MPKTEWRELEQIIGRDAFKLEGTPRVRTAAVILCAWLAFYVLAIAHALLSPPVVGNVTTAETQEQSPTDTSR